MAEIENEKPRKSRKAKVEPQAEVTADAPVEFTSQLGNLDFIDGAADPDEVQHATELATMQALAQRLAETANPMQVGEVEQLPIFGLADEATDSIEGSDDGTTEPTEFIDNDRLISVIESLLFATDRPVSIATIKQIFKGSNIKTKDITRAVDLLASKYAGPDCGVALEEILGGYQLRTKIDNTEYLKRLQKVRPFRLSGPALEVLAIIAYKQPMTKAEVDQIRGVESGHLVRALMERGLVAFGEKSDLPGRPMNYLTTRKFLEIFGLRNLKELPTLSEIDQLIPEGIGEEEDKESLSDLTASMSTDIKSSYSEGEEELQVISDSLKVIDTTAEFFEQEKIRQRAERDRERAQDLRERLTVGEAVEEKDKRWLVRYEAKVEQAAAEAHAAGAQDRPAAPIIVEEEGSEPAAGLAEQLAALSAENQEQGEQAAGEADSDFDELSVKLDYEDDEAIIDS